MGQKQTFAPQRAMSAAKADDKILLVDPATRQIVDIVIKQEAQ